MASTNFWQQAVTSLDDSDQKITPVIGSAISSIKIKEQATTDVMIYMKKSSLISTERLLRQYMKHHLLKPWGFRLIDAFTKGHIPVLPIAYHSHASQSLKHPSIHHITSKLISIIASTNTVTSAMLVDIWLFTMTINAVKKITTTSNSKPNNFIEFKQVLENTAHSKYLSYLVTTAATIEGAVITKETFILNVYPEKEAKDVALTTGKDGLFNDIKKTNEATMKEITDAL